MTGPITTTDYPRESPSLIKQRNKVDAGRKKAKQLPGEPAKENLPSLNHLGLADLVRFPTDLFLTGSSLALKR